MSLNWYAGWLLVLSALVSGAGVGMFFHRPDFLGGYGSFRRRLLRLGHIACAALGMLNVIFAIASRSMIAPSVPIRLASVLLASGGVLMATICFLSAWRPSFRHTFFIPVMTLIAAVALILAGGKP